MIPTLCSVVLALASVPQNPPPAAVEMVSLQHLLRTPASPLRVPTGTMLLRDGEVDQVGGGNGPTQDAVVAALAALHGEAIQAGRLRWEVGAGNLLLAGEAAEVEAVRKSVRRLEETLARTMQLEFVLWDATDRGTPATTLDETAFGEFSRGRTAMLRLVGSVNPQQTADLQQVRAQGYVRDVDVEVASKATISDPVVDVFRDGAIASVRAIPLAGSDEFVLFGMFAVAERRGIPRTVQPGHSSAPDIEVPTLDSCMGTFSGRLGSGSALAVTLRGHPALGGQVVLTVRLLAKDRPAADAKASFAVLPCQALLDDSLLRVDAIPQPDGTTQLVKAPSAGRLPEPLLLDLCRAAIGEGQGTLWSLGGHLVVQGDAGAQGRVRSLLRDLENRMLRTVSVTSTGQLPSTVQPAPTSGPAPNLLFEVSAPCLTGRELRLARVVETTAITDIEVEIAQEASMTNPVVDLLQSGSWLSASVAPAGSGMHVDLQLRCLQAAQPLARSIMPNGVWTPTDVNGSVLRHQGAVGNAAVLEHGDGPLVPIDGRSWRSSLQTIVRW